MTDETTTLPELGVEVPNENYDVGFGPNPPASYAQLLREAFVALDTQFTGISKTAIDKQTHTGESATFGEVSGIVYANAQPGATLDEKFQNALGELHHDGGRIVVAPPTDGSVWQWTKNVELVADDPGGGTGGGYHLDFAPGTRIMFTGNTNPLTINHPSGSRQRKDVTLTGGFWSGADASNPDGCFHVKSAADTTISAEHIAQFSNSAGDSFGVKFSNYDRFCEKYAVEGFRITGTDVCVDFEPESYLVGQGETASGTGSFVDGAITDMAFTPHEYGVRIRGEHAANTLRNVAFFPASADATALLIDGSLRNAPLTGLRFDNPGGTAGFDGVVTGPNFVDDEPPIIMGAHFAHLQNNVVRNDPGHFLPAMWTDFGFWHIGDLEDNSTSFRVSQDGQVRLPTPKYVGRDLTTTGGAQTDLGYHDPSIGGDANTEGPAFHDGANWISIVDGTTIS
jgi:hypothetical protein